MHLKLSVSPHPAYNLKTGLSSTFNISEGDIALLRTTKSYNKQDSTEYKSLSDLTFVASHGAAVAAEVQRVSAPRASEWENGIVIQYA